MKTITAEDLAAMATVAPEIDEIGETADEWWFGLFGLDKSEAYARYASKTWPRWRDGFSYNVTDRMHLRAQDFHTSDGDKAVGVVLVVPEEGYEKYVGWARSERSQQIRTWVERLNLEMDRLRELWNAAGRPE